MEVTTSDNVCSADASSHPTRPLLRESTSSSQTLAAPMELSSKVPVTLWAGLSINISHFEGPATFEGTFSCVCQVTVKKRRVVKPLHLKKKNLKEAFGSLLRRGAV